MVPMKRKTKRVGKITAEMCDKIRELKAASMKFKEIAFVIKRDFDIDVSTSMLSNIVHGYKHADKGDFTEEDEKRINALIDGESVDIVTLPRIEKFGVCYMVKTTSIEETMKHFNESLSINLTKQDVDEINIEVLSWLDSGDVNGENEEWFKKLIEK